MFYVLWPMVYQRMLIFHCEEKHFHHEEKYFHREEKYFHHDEKQFTGRGSAFQYADDGEQRKADRSQSGQYPCGNGIITMLGRRLERKAERKRQNKAVNIGINGIRLASLNSSLHILDSKITLLEIL